MQKKGSIKKDFLTGLVLLLPIAISVWVLIQLFTWADSILGDVLYEYLGRRIPGLGIVVTLLLIYLIGVFSGRLIGKSIAHKVESILEKTPILKGIYKPLKNIFSKFSDTGKSNFKQVVLVDFPNTKGKSIGFVTNTHISLDESEKICVFVPTSPNPTMGFLMLYDRDDVTAVDITVEQGLSMVLSIGSSYDGAMHAANIIKQAVPPPDAQADGIQPAEE
ncbi:MAG TPA: DUF502 domain-containing protein [Candidatus Limiplasma sp.]|nr:DUF502 domain-containing protein [Candidatus Limiplasma sp.]